VIPQRRRVVVTGIGLVSPLASGPNRLGVLRWRAARDRSCLLFDASSIPCRIAGEVKGFDPRDFLDQKDVKKTARFIQFCDCRQRICNRHARLQMQKENAERVGVYVVAESEASRSSRGNTPSSPRRVPDGCRLLHYASIVNLAAGQISIRTGAKGPNLAVRNRMYHGRPRHR